MNAVATARSHWIGREARVSRGSLAVFPRPPRDSGVREERVLRRRIVETLPFTGAPSMVRNAAQLDERRVLRPHSAGGEWFAPSELPTASTGKRTNGGAPPFPFGSAGDADPASASFGLGQGPRAPKGKDRLGDPRASFSRRACRPSLKKLPRRGSGAR
ncbi:MAG: hypothetical protein D6718_03925 [Acidobacteria bacterium]|nr:MAG: hypothetical protein D6718_03925 [Acidobacteriota bacterium]